MHASNALVVAYEVVLLGLELFVALFLLLHDWVPLGRLNNLGAVQGEDSVGRRVFVTLLPAIPVGLGLYWSVMHYGRAYPGDLAWFLWVTYGVLVMGMLQAWWIPYLLIPDAKRAARYQILFRNTHRFLPERNGISPDTLHCSLHLATLLILVLLFLRSRVLA